MEARYELRCLGSPTLLVDGAVARVRARKHLALLIYLAVEDRWHRREHLAELLWPKASVGDSRHSLSTALSLLRGKLDRRTVLADRDRVRVARERLALDLDRLAIGDVNGAATTPLLHIGPFLHEFEIPDAIEFDLWRDRRAAQLLPALRDALVRSMEQCRRAGDFRQIEMHADVLLSLDPLSEDAVRARMEGRAFAGDRLGAVRVFERWKAEIDTELGAAPSPLLHDMATRLKHHQSASDAKNGVDVARAEPRHDRVFVGRTPEYQQLYDTWERLKHGAARHTLLLGESGVGKTTLVGRLLTAAVLEGATASRVQCHDVERDVPFAALSTLLNGLLDAPGASATSPAALAELSALLPGIKTLFPSAAARPAAEGEAARVRLIEAALELLAAVADERPTILVVDDLHRADDATIAAIHVMLRRLAERPVLIILAARSAELMASTQGQRLVESWRATNLPQITLSPLSDDESRLLLDALLQPTGAIPSAAERRALVGCASGIPMVLELLVRDWGLHGRESLALSLTAMTEQPAAMDPASASYELLTPRIIQALDVPARSALATAAILGTDLNDQELYGLVDLSLGQVLAALTQLADFRILRKTAKGLEFANELLRAHAYLAVPDSVRKEIHSRVANRMIDRWRQARGAAPLSIAWHCMRAGRIDEATQFLLHGAAEAVRIGAVHEAERSLATALPHLTNPADRRATLLLLVDTLQEQGRWADAVVAIDQFGDVTDPLVRAAQLTAQSYLNGDHTTAHRLAAELLSILAAADSAHVRIRGLRAGAKVVSWLRDTDLARQFLLHTESLDTGDLSVYEHQQLVVSRGQLLYYSGDRETALRVLQAFLATPSPAETRTSTIARIQVGVGALHCSFGDYDSAFAATHAAYATAVLLGNDELATGAAGQLALCSSRLGRYDEALEWAGRGQRTLTESNTPYVRVQLACYAALAKVFKGLPFDAVAEVDDIESHLMASRVPPWILQAWKLRQADIRCLVSRRAEALATARETVDLVRPQLYSHFFAGAFCRWLVALGQQDGLTASASSLLRELASNVEPLDTAVQVEVLWAAAHAAGTDVDQARLREEAEAKLRRLPQAMGDQLRLLWRCSLAGSP